MIQRIQTLYLIVVVACMSLLIACPLATFDLVGAAQAGLPAQIKFMAFGTDGIKATMYLGILASLISILALAAIVLFKRRMLQVRLCTMQMILLVAAIGYMVYYHISLNNLVGSMGEYMTRISVVNVAPLVALICARLAMRAILRDEYLVRSADRIR